MTRADWLALLALAALREAERTVETTGEEVTEDEGETPESEAA